MSAAEIFDNLALEAALSEIDGLRRRLPPSDLTHLAQEVVLRVAHNLRGAVPPELQPSAEEIDALCAALLSDNAKAGAVFIDAAQGRGSSYDTLCLAYLGGAARRLGEIWDEDGVTFYRVTVAAGRIYAILRALRRTRLSPLPDLRRSAIFASVPGEDHTLGVSMAADLARDRGWDVELFVGLSHAALVEQLEQRQTPLIGLTASGRRSLAPLIRLIVALRISNPAARILVCGQIGRLDVNLVGVSGADAIALDFETALAEMERLLA